MSLISGACNTFEWIVKFLISLRRFKEKMHDLIKLRLISGRILARVEYSLPNHITMYKCSRFLERGFICKGDLKVGVCLSDFISFILNIP